MLISFDENSLFCSFTNEPEEVKDLSERIHAGYFLNSIKKVDKEPNKTIWIAHGRESCHMTNSLKGMTDLKAESSNINNGCEKIIQAIIIGIYVHKDWRKTKIVMKNVRHIQGIFVSYWA